MTTNRKNELIAQLVSILSELIETNDSEQVAEVTPNAVEVLTIKECTEAVKGLSEHTVRKLIKQGKLLSRKSRLNFLLPQAHQAGQAVIFEDGRWCERQDAYQQG